MINVFDWMIENLMRSNFSLGLGSATYMLGVEDSGLLKGLTQEEATSSLETLRIMAKKIGATISIKGERIVENSPGKHRRKVIEVLVQKKFNEETHVDEVRVVVVGGCVEAGKSSLIGVLTQGENDNGKGKGTV